MRWFDYFFGVVLGELVLRHNDNLSRTLQSTNISGPQGQKIAATTQKTLQSLRSEESLRLFWTKVVRMGSELEVDDPTMPRR